MPLQIQPGSRAENIQQEHIHPNLEQEQEAHVKPAGSEYDPILVRVLGDVATTTAADQYGAYQTYVISTGLNPIETVAPYDPLRQYMYIMTIDEPIVLSTVKEQVEAAANTVAAVPNPQGAYLPVTSWTPAIRHNDAIYAAATSATPTRVVVLIERGNPHEKH
jgi:hypothetical protein